MEDTMKSNRFKYLLLALLLTVLTVVGLGTAMSNSGAGVMAAPTAPLLWLDPVEAVAVTGSSTDVDVTLSDISNVFGIEFTMAFDPAIVTVVGESLTPGSCPAPQFVAANTADNTAGTIEYAATQLAPTPPCNGGIVATIEFMCADGLENEATTPVTITTSIVADPDGTPVEHFVQNGAVRCEANIFFIEGAVELQGWDDLEADPPKTPAGVLVELKDSGGTTIDSTVVSDDGAFSFTGNTGETYSVVASYDRYLTIEQAGITSSVVGEVINLGTGRLPAGDINGDGLVNILDISGVAGNYGKSSPVLWMP
jgi:hypothetical protein